jgi:iron transport multicopper oxidase
MLNAGSSSAPSVKPGVQATALTLYTQNAVAGYSTQQSASLTGIAVSSSPWLSTSPLQVDFPEVVIGSTAGAGGSASTFFVQNVGKASLSISGTQPKRATFIVSSPSTQTADRPALYCQVPPTRCPWHY